MGKTFLGSLTALARRTVDTPVPFTSRGAERALPFMRPAGMEQQLRAMGSVGTLFSIVNRTSNATAMVEWKLWRKAKSGKKEDRIEVTSHAALDLWNKPNPFMPRQEFVETFQQHVDLVGEGWWVIARHPGSTIPLEAWPVRPDRMTPCPSQDSFLDGYVYTSPDGEQVPLGLDEVIFLRMPNPLDPYRGMGPVQSVLADLDATRYSAEWNRNFFLNSAEPGGIIEVPTPLSDPDFDQLRDRWNEQHRGVANAHRVAILEHGKWIDRKLSQRDMQFVELRSVSRQVIREAYGIPAFALGEVTDINRATAEASKAWFAEQLTIPRLERIKGALNHDLLPMFGATTHGLEFDYESPVPADPESEAAQLVSKTTAAKTLIDSGAYGPEVLASMGLPEVAFGQPNADPNRELLIDLVKGAPSLAPLLLPLLGFDLSAAQLAAGPREVAELVQKIYLGVGKVLTAQEARAVLVAAGAQLDPSTPVPPLPKASASSWDALAAQVLEDADAGDIDAAMRWVVVAEDDDNTCAPCRENNGHLYRNREQAYRDYPGGAGYVHCVGAEHGNDCRCKVVKRRAGGSE